MPKGQHGGKEKSKTGKGPADTNIEDKIAPTDSFISIGKQDSQLLTLIFSSKTAQHAALSRIEAFYESHLDANKYLTLDEANEMKLCQHYEAFNFPLDVVKTWLQCMKERHNLAEHANEGQDVDSQEEIPWYNEYCNEYELHLLKYLERLGVLQEGDNMQDPSMKPPIYLISTLATKQNALMHERLHFLYYISAEYREKVQIEYQNLSSRTRKIIENDLNMRKYSSSVWIDELQAYISENAGEFGKSTYEECQIIQSSLKPLQRRLWKEYDLMDP